ncbi:hypothetical protein DV495_002221 [Geotrichum candidum]|nr:hypothetical protein DV495_002221 [Geotrichum candidum]
MRTCCGTKDLASKSIILLGRVKDQQAIVTLEKVAFSLDGAKDISALGLLEIEEQDHNDVYFKGVGTMAQNLDRPATKINIIYPATETHIKKYRQQKKRVVLETPELYQKIVLPYISSMRGDRIKWVYNILHEGYEADRVLLRDDDPVNGFVLLPDLKWDLVSLSSLYFVAIVMRNDIASLRDLNSSHIPYLTLLREQILIAIKDKYGLDRSQLLLYIHYQPSYYHFHIHVTHIDLERRGSSFSILLDNVIDQLQFLGPEGFLQSTFSYFIKENHDLWAKGFALEK